MRCRWLVACAAGMIAATAAPALPAAGVGGPVAVAHTGGIPLNVRTGASLAHARVATIPDGRRLSVVCQVRGQLIAGHARRTDRWDRLSDGRYVADANVAWRSPRLRWCSAPAGGAGPAGTWTAIADTGGIRLNVRSGPALAHRRTGTVADGARVAVACQASGQEVTGHVRRTDRWVRLRAGGYVSEAYLAWRPTRPALRACAGVPNVVALAPAEFIALVARPARESMRRHRVPASVTIAQAILESGWGRSELAYVDRNYFGIKCFGGPGRFAKGCRTYPTSECDADRCFRTRARFRVYASLADSVRDHGRFLAVDNPRYRAAFARAETPEAFTVAIHRAGYATSPGYAKAIISLIRQYRLHRFDR